MVRGLCERLGLILSFNSTTKLSPSEIHNLVLFSQGCPVSSLLVAAALRRVCNHQLSWKTFAFHDGGVIHFDDHKITLVECNMVTLACRDGKMSAQGTLLAEHFQFISDFVVTYPGEEIPIPYSTAEIDMALSGLTSANTNSLRFCLDVVKYLNPIYNAYFLNFDLSGVPLEELKLVADRLTLEERLALRYNGSDGGLTAPYGGEGHYILAYAEGCRRLLVPFILFPECPSWLFSTFGRCAMIRSDAVNVALCRLAYTADFSQDSDIVVDNAMVAYIMKMLRVVLNHPETDKWTKAARILAMLGIRSKELLNEDVDVIPPYSVIPWRKQLTPSNVGKLKSLYPGEWKDSYVSNVSLS